MYRTGSLFLTSVTKLRKIRGRSAKPEFIEAESRMKNAPDLHSYFLYIGMNVFSTYLKPTKHRQILVFSRGRPRGWSDIARNRWASLLDLYLRLEGNENLAAEGAVHGLHILILNSMGRQRPPWAESWPIRTGRHH